MSRLAELEEQLREIELRWKAPSQDRPPHEGIKEPTSEHPPLISDEGHAGDTTETWPKGADEFQLIQESARAKALAAMRNELLPGSMPASGQHSSSQLPPHHPGHASSSGKDSSERVKNASETQHIPDSSRTAMGDITHKFRQQARPSLVEASAKVNFARREPSQPWQLVSIPPAPGAISGSFVGNLSVPTWEGQRAAALVALEGERRYLQSKVDELEASQQESQLQLRLLVGQYEQQLQQLSGEHQQQTEQQESNYQRTTLEDSLKHQKNMQQASGLAGEKLEQLQHSAWQLFMRQRYAKLAACAFFLWRRVAVHSRKLAWAESVWYKRRIGNYMAEWQVYAHTLRSERLATNVALELESQRLTILGARCALLHMRHLLSAWRKRIQHLAIKRRLRLRADRHWRRVAGQAFMTALLAGVHEAPMWKQDLAWAKLRKVRLAAYFKGWTQQHRLHLLSNRKLMLRQLKHWSGYVLALYETRLSVAALQSMWLRRFKCSLLWGWHQAAECRRKDKAAAAAVSASNRLRLAKRCIFIIRTRTRQEHAIRRMKNARFLGVVRHWHCKAARSARNCRVVATHRRVLLLRMQRAVLLKWHVLGAEGVKQQQMEEAALLQGTVHQLEYELRAVELQGIAFGEVAAAGQIECRALRAEVMQNLVLVAPEGFLSKQLQWRSLPADPHEPVWPAPRCRHLSLLLPALQGLAGQSAPTGAAGTTVAASNVPLLSSTIVVFGGVGGDTWYKDVHILTVNQTVTGSVSSSWQVPLTISTGDDGNALPHLRDFAGCACGPGQFLVHGGFDGSVELSSIFVFDMHRLDAAGATPDAFSMTCRLVQPRNQAPAPRSHHTACYDSAGRSVLIFGGYSSQIGGLVSELWAFSFDHMEWWQVETLGDPPSPRRGHVAVVVAGRLMVHGGYNSSQQLDDIWSLDLSTWHWTRMACKGSAPSGRRGHAADVVSGRYLVVHGGFDGTSLLSDAHQLDMETSTWSRLEATGGLDVTPAPRSLHTLTAVGHACLLLGGSGALGALGDIHLLESPAVTSGLAQQHRLIETRHSLAEEQRRSAGLQGQLGQAVQERDWQLEQQQVVEGRARELLVRYNSAVQRIEALHDTLLAREAEASEARDEQHSLMLQLATLQRRLDRARDGGRLAGSEAEAMYEQLRRARAHIAVLERSVEQAMAAAHDAQAVALQISGERQALQMQLAASANEAAVLRQMVGAVEREHRAALDRMQARADDEIERVLARSENEVEVVRAKQAKAAEEAEAGGADATKAERQPQLQQLQTPGARLSPQRRVAAKSPFLSRQDSQPAKPSVAELQLALLENDYSLLAQELAQAKQEAAREGAAHQAAKRAAADAAEDLHRLEFRYQQSIEQLEQQVRHLQRSNWTRDLVPPRSRLARPRVPQQINRQNTEQGGGSAEEPSAGTSLPPGSLLFEGQVVEVLPVGHLNATQVDEQARHLYQISWQGPGQPPGLDEQDLSTRMAGLEEEDGMSDESQEDMPQVEELRRFRSDLL